MPSGAVGLMASTADTRWLGAIRPGQWIQGPRANHTARNCWYLENVWVGVFTTLRRWETCGDGIFVADEVYVRGQAWECRQWSPASFFMGRDNLGQTVLCQCTYVVLSAKTTDVCRQVTFNFKNLALLCKTGRKAPQPALDFKSEHFRDILLPTLPLANPARAAPDAVNKWRSPCITTCLTSTRNSIEMCLFLCVSTASRPDGVVVVAVSGGSSVLALSQGGPVAGGSAPEPSKQRHWAETPSR